MNEYNHYLSGIYRAPADALMKLCYRRVTEVPCFHTSRYRGKKTVKNKIVVKTSII